MKYIALPDTWFDAGTEAMLIDDYRKAERHPFNAGLFLGIRNGKPDEEICDFDEFEAVDA